MPKKAGEKRYTLVLPDELFDEVKAIADRKGTTVVEIIRKYLNLGLVITKKVEETPDASLLIREGDHEREIIIL